MAKILLSPSKYIQGAGEIAKLGKYTVEYGKKAFIVTTEVAYKSVTGVLEEGFKESKCDYIVECFHGECSMNEINRLKEIAKRESCDVIIGLGGGKILDTAKAVAYYAKTPVLICPTSASTDAVCAAILAADQLGKQKVLNMVQKEYWNDISSNKEFTTPFQSKEFEKYVNVQNSILDVGCGYGRTLNELYRQGYRNLLGIDFAEGMIMRGKEQYPYLDLRVQKSSKIDLEDQSVDAVILFAVLTCISKNEDQQNLVNEIDRVLKPNGILYVNDFLLNTDDRNSNRYEEYQKAYADDKVQAREYGVFKIPEGAVFRHHDESWLKQLFVSFEEQKYDKLIFPTMNGHESNGFYFIGKKCSKRKK